MILYKYRNFTGDSKIRTIEIISKQELFFASIESFNDPFDGKVHLRFDGKLNEVRAAQIRSQYSMKLKKEQKFEGAKFEDVKKLVDKKITEEYLLNHNEHKEILDRIQKLHNRKGVLSLSRKCDNILMWSHYTDNHKGLCFGFQFSNEEAFANPKRVRYQTHYDDIWGWLHTDGEIADRVLYSKAIDWEYEDEYRILKDCIGVEKFQTTSLKEIVFGSMMAYEDKHEIIDLCREHNLKPKYKQAVLNLKTYELNIIDCDDLPEKA